MTEDPEKYKPFVIGRMSFGTETKIIRVYLAKDWPINPRGEAHKRSGIYPETPQGIYDFAVIYAAAMRKMNN